MQTGHHKTSGTQKQLWSIGGGKGGVGKSFISSSLAICLGRLGYKVIIVDMDLGSANLHTCLGAPIPKLSISDFLKGRIINFEQLEAETHIKNVSFVSGFNDALNISNLNEKSKTMLLDGIKSLDADYVLLDLGAGTHSNTLDFFLSADNQILTTVPEPTSIENTYRFIKSSYYRKVRLAEKNLGLQKFIEETMDHKNKNGIRTPADLVRYLQEKDPKTGALFASQIENTQMHLILNQIRTRSDVELGRSMKSVCRKYFGIEVEYLGYLDYDNAVWQALRKKRPLILEYPYSTVVGQFLKMTKQLVNVQPLKAVV